MIATSMRGRDEIKIHFSEQRSVSDLIRHCVSERRDKLSDSSDNEDDFSEKNVHRRTTMLQLQGAKATAKDLPNCGGNTSLWSLRQEGVDHHLQEIKKSENLVQHRNLINEVPTAKIDRTNDDGTDNRHDGLTHCASGAYFTAQKEGADKEQRLVSQEEALVAQHPSSISHITDKAQTVMELQQRLKINIVHPRMTCCSSECNMITYFRTAFF